MQPLKMFTLPSEMESINLSRVLSVKINPYTDDEVLVYLDVDRPALVYKGEDAEALAEEFGLKWPDEDCDDRR